jgi:hypothetical protein
MKKQFIYGKFINFSKYLLRLRIRYFLKINISKLEFVSKVKINNKNDD